MAFVNLMGSSIGRVARIAAGLAMISIGLVVGGGWLALSVAGIVPLAAGALGFCLIAPLFHQPLRATGSLEA